MKIRTSIFSIITLLIIISFCEIISFLLLEFVFLPKGYVYRPELNHTSLSYQKVQALPFNPWGRQEIKEPLLLSPGLDKRRVGKVYNEKVCISLYGDSFTEDPRWGQLVSDNLNCNILNYGVGGFGIDQAWKVYENNLHDNAKIAVLGFFSEDITRHVTRNRAWEYNPVGYGSAKEYDKFRFILNTDGELVPVPPEAKSFKDFKLAVSDPEKFIQHDYFAAGKKSGPPYLHFPYTITLLKIFSHWKLQPRFSGKPYYADLYTPNHDSNALEISVKIVEKFVNLARKRKAQPIVVIMPSVLDFEHFRKTDHWIYQPLIDELNLRSIPVHNAGPSMLEYVTLKNFCSMFQINEIKFSLFFNDCGGHYSDKGYEALGKFVTNTILRNYRNKLFEF